LFKVSSILYLILFVLTFEYDSFLCVYDKAGRGQCGKDLLLLLLWRLWAAQKILLVKI